ncbi:MAG TPA: hypothetical protein VIH35_02475 [Kiritimatiellia bacterium]
MPVVENMEMGLQPLDGIMERLGLTNHALVAASGEQLTHKVVQKGRLGRQLTRNAQEKILRALSRAAGPAETFTRDQLFTYRGRV